MSISSKVRGFFQQAQDTLSLSGLSALNGRTGRIAGALAVVYVLLVVGLGIWWSSAPDAFNVADRAQVYADREGVAVVRGSSTTAALIGVIDTLLEKDGGYTHNDLFPPGLLM
ncbi:MAG: DUF2333 family protein, partial [Cellvibrionales bacterium]